MGMGDTLDPRPREVPFTECVQHLLRLRSGVAVRGNHGHRLIWALTNKMLLMEASGKGFAVHRVAMRRLRGRVVGQEVALQQDLQLVSHVVASPNQQHNGGASRMVLGVGVEVGVGKQESQHL